MHRFVYIYGFDSLRALVDFKFLVDENITVRGFQSVAQSMIERKPSIKKVYVIDNSKHLKEAFRELITSRGFPAQIEFWDYVETNGLQIIDRDKV